MNPGPDNLYSAAIRLSLDHEDIWILEIQGFLDTNSVSDFENTVQAFLEKDIVPRLIVDTSELLYISSAGMGALMRLSQGVKQKNGALVMLSPPSRIMAVLEMLDFRKVFAFADDMDDAVEILRLSS